MNLELKEKALKLFYELASDYLRVAEYVFENGNYREATDLAYNSLEAMIKALLLLEMDELPRTHSGVVDRFGEIYIKGEKSPREWGRELRRALELRNRARYDWVSLIPKEEAEKIINFTKELKDYVEGKIRE